MSLSWDYWKFVKSYRPISEEMQHGRSDGPSIETSFREAYLMRSQEV